MRRYLVLAVLGIVVLAPSLASAQIFRFGRGGRGSNYYDNYGYSSYGWGGYGGYYQPYPSYSYSSPNVYDQGFSGVYQAGYNAPMGNLGNRVRLQVIVPDPNAELFIQGERMNTMGPTRAFISPDLEPGKSYSYSISIRRPGGGGEEKRTVDVQPGGTYTVDFSKPSGERMENMDRSNERLPTPKSDYNAPRSDYNAPKSDRPKSNEPPPPSE